MNTWVQKYWESLRGSHVDNTNDLLAKNLSMYDLTTVHLNNLLQPYLSWFENASVVRHYICYRHEVDFQNSYKFEWRRELNLFQFLTMWRKGTTFGMKCEEMKIIQWRKNFHLSLNSTKKIYWNIYRNS